MGKIHGICAVQNEGDVIAESVAWAARLCEHVWVWNLGSTDETGERLGALSLPNVTVEHRPPMRFVNSIRGKLFAEVRHHIPEGSWLYILDPDEFLVGDPSPMLSAAEEEGAGIVGVWQVNFLPTAGEAAELAALGEARWSAIPLAERLRHYRAGWFEHRFVHASPGFAWDSSGLFSRWRDGAGQPLRVSRHFGFVRHYRCRSPAQVLKRHATRHAREGVGDGLFRWTPSADFLSYVQPRRRMCHWPPGGGELCVPWIELQRARWVWSWTRAKNHLQRRFGVGRAAARARAEGS